MIIEVVIGCVLIVLGLCALLGLPALAFRVYDIEKRSHEIEQAVVKDVRNVGREVFHGGHEKQDVERDARDVGEDVRRAERKVADGYDDDVGAEHSIGGLPEASDA
ncbi:MAG: hypothetical protein WA614_07970 [Acidimicrobiales bacterium]|jgi:hypothetical protein